MPSRHATKKGKLNGVARKELNLSASTSLVEKTVLGTNEDTVFGRVTKMWGNGHCQVLAVHGKIRVQLHKVRIPKNRLGKKGSTPITLNSVVSIFVGREFEPTKVRDADAFDITAVLDDKQVRTLIKSSLAPSWFLKTADEISSTEEATAVEEEEGFEWDTSADEASGDDAVVEFAAQAALSRLQKGRDAGHLGDALTKKQLREVKKITAKASAGKKLVSETSRPVDDESDDDDVPTHGDGRLTAAQLAFLAAKQETKAAEDSKPSHSATKDAWIDRI
jgi:hypothetical protein